MMRFKTFIVQLKMGCQIWRLIQWQQENCIEKEDEIKAFDVFTKQIALLFIKSIIMWNRSVNTAQSLCRMCSLDYFKSKRESKSELLIPEFCSYYWSGGRQADISHNIFSSHAINYLFCRLIAISHNRLVFNATQHLSLQAIVTFKMMNLVHWNCFYKNWASLRRIVCRLRKDEKNHNINCHYRFPPKNSIL